MLYSLLLFACLNNKRNSNIIKVHHKVGHKGPVGELMYISTLSLTSALDGGEWSTHHHALAALPPGNTQYPLYRRLGEPPGQSGPMQKISPPTGIRSLYHPAHSTLLYQLSYSGPQYKHNRGINSQIISDVTAKPCSTNIPQMFQTHNYQPISMTPWTDPTNTGMRPTQVAVFGL